MQMDLPEFESACHKLALPPSVYKGVGGYVRERDRDERDLSLHCQQGIIVG